MRLVAGFPPRRSGFASELKKIKLVEPYVQKCVHSTKIDYSVLRHFFINYMGSYDIFQLVTIEMFEKSVNSVVIDEYCGKLFSNG
jgi:hypothetical protein